ncbi:MAG: Asp-tRNA(Asn)/Glu-tRNA(Gln) amidotransferase GatCAB subunit B, partial [Alphaproteobacteria bacterium]|nr:Asp-tRNA(Asn)/Glu-tRNA(Gln) amidotransferase GatCAB subunit B [Alphaproteobacteria bacterium]
ILDKTISGKIAKTVFAEMTQSGSAPAKIVKDLGLVQIQDEGAIRKVIDEVIAANPVQVAQYKAGKVQLFGFFVGQSMKAMQGKGNPEMINKILKETLG